MACVPALPLRGGDPLARRERGVLHAVLPRREDPLRVRAERVHHEAHRLRVHPDPPVRRPRESTSAAQEPDGVGRGMHALGGGQFRGHKSCCMH